MKILAVTYAYAPLLVPASFRLLKWFRGLDERDHEITVIAVDPRSFEGPKDESLERLSPARVQLHRVWSPENGPLYRFLHRYDRVFYRLVEPRKREWLRPAVEAAARSGLNACDVIFTCSQPAACHMVGLELKRRTGKPWVAYFSDPWVDNPFRQSQSKAVKKLNLAHERRVIAAADFLIFSSPETVELVMRKYPPELAKKVGVLGHCFVPEWYGGPFVDPSIFTPGKTILLHTGLLYGPRSPAPLLRALELLSRDDAHADRLEVWFFGGMETKHLEACRSSSASKHVRIHQNVPYLAALSLMRRADCLLLIDAPVSEAAESVFLPSKLVDYLGSGRPILAATPRRGASARVLQQCGGLVCDVDDPQQLARALAHIARGELPPPPSESETAAYHYREVSGQLERFLSTVG